MADGQTFKTKSPRFVQELWLTESKNRLKQKCKKISMTALIFIEICERDYIRMSEVLSIFVNYLSLYIFASNLALNSSATTEGWPKDSLWFITNNRSFTIKHDALFLNWHLFVHHITVNLSYIPIFPENGNSSEFFQIQRGKVLWEVGDPIGLYFLNDPHIFTTIIVLNDFQTIKYNLYLVFQDW